MPTTLSTTTFRRFAEHLDQRIAAKQHLTEDSVRYSFFVALLQTTTIQQHEVVLELPHPEFHGKEIDTYINAISDRQAHFIEVKYHRGSASTSPKPQKAGSLFKDFSRLAAVKTPDCRRFVVYLTDSEMASYFEKHSRNYSHFWAQQAGNHFDFNADFVAKTTATFKKSSGDLHPAKIRVAFATTLLDSHVLKVFEIEEISC